MEVIMAKERSRADASSIKQKDPDRGPPIHEGAHHWDKGYDAEPDVFEMKESFPDDNMRGNAYVKNNQEIIMRDTKKLYRGIFTKIH
jgi:hypothetical protein